MRESKKPLAWITGGGSGIGFAAAKEVGVLGFRIVISGRNGERLKEAVQKLSVWGIDAAGVVMDVANTAQTVRSFREISENYGDVSLLVCSAGTNVQNRLWSNMNIEEFKQVIDTNLNGVVHTISLVLPGMRKQKRGQIIIISSLAGWVYSSGSGVAYSGSKVALGYVSTSINEQEGRNGIRSCVICPGEVNTGLLRNRPIRPSPEVLEKMLQPGDVGRLIAFIAGNPPHVCMNEVVISPTWNRLYIGIPEVERNAGVIQDFPSAEIFKK